MPRVRTLPALLAVLALVLAGCGGGGSSEGGGTETTATETTATTGGDAGEGDATAGEIIWVQEGCNNCHAIDGMPATSLDGPNFDKTKPSHEEIIDAVTNGKGSMQSFEDTLSAQDIQNVAAYIEQAAQGS
jgi:mono/diheme cytochrome c family protein